MSFENFPYSNFHELNLDWIIQKLKEAYSSENPPDYPVKSVNGMTGDVIIAIPANLVSSVNGETGDVVLYRNPLTQFPATDEQRWNLFRICDGDERGIEFDEDGAHRIEGTRRILIYDAENQPDYPVTSVNGQTGDVRISAGVNSVNGKTGNVVTPFVNPNTDILKLDSNSNTVLWGLARDVSGGEVALYITRGSGTPQAFIRYTPTGGEAINLPLLTNADIPAGAGVLSVNTKTGAVTLYGSDILTTIDGENTIATDINNTLNMAIENTNKIIFLDDCIFSHDTGLAFTWYGGVYTAAAGIFSKADRFICADQYLNNKYDRAKCPANMGILIQAWNESDNYIGVYNPNNKQFAIYSAIPTELFTDQINIVEIRKNYPTYKLKITARNDSGEIIYPSEGENIIFDYIATNDVSSLQEQITALQTSQTTQDQQISALQAADTAHNQQISDLQAADTAHNQQISALQAADSTHDQQISAIQAVDSTQNQQISELYTRTGVYTIYIENVNSLPLRYPASGTDAKIKNTNMVVSMDMNIPGAQTSDWTITTYDGYLEITGSISGIATLTLYLA